MSPAPPRYRCLCFALPTRVLAHAARKAGSDHAAALQAHARHCDTLRGARAEVAAGCARDVSAATGWHRRVFDARHGQQLPGTTLRQEGAAPVADATANQAYDNVGITLDFFARVFGRHSLDDRGMRVDASVHYGQNFTNAMWTGSQMLFGDGDGVHILGFAQSLDIVAHELSHAVTQHVVRGGLGEVHADGKARLMGQAGALNESMSDVFASLARQWHLGQDVHEANWLIGEGILAPGLGHAVRSLKDPGNPAHTYEDDDQARDMRGYVPEGDAHTNSGIPNHAFYLAATAIGGKAWEKAGPIWYQALHALKPQASFEAAAHATVDAAASRHGADSPELKAVTAAWRKVRVLK